MQKSIRNTRGRSTNSLTGFSPRFWALIGASFVDHVDRKMVFPFFSLDITDRYDDGMTQAGVLLCTLFRRKASAKG